MSVEPQPQKKRGLLVALVVGVFALAAVGAAALLVNIAERKEAARHQYVKVVEVTEADTDPAKWGKNWPREYDGYMQDEPSPRAPSTVARRARARGSRRRRRPTATRG